MLKKKITGIVLASALALTMTACGGSADKGGDAKEAASSCKDAKLAYMTVSTSVPFWRSIAVGAESQGKEEGAQVTTYDSKLSQSTQMKNVQDIITSGADAIIISPTDSAAAVGVLDKAKAAGVPVVIADVGTDGGEYASYVATDNVAGAAKAADMMLEALKEKGITSGEIGMISISQTRQNGKDRTKGFTEKVEAAGFKMIPLLESSEYTRSEGLKFTQDLMTAHPNMVGLFTQHDEATLGAVTAIQTANAKGKFVLVGFDGSPDTMQAIKDGIVYGASMQQPVLMGVEAVKAACSVITGKTPEKRINVDTLPISSLNVRDKEAEASKTVFAK